MQLIGFVLLAFFAGSIPFGLLISKTFCGIDPRRDGSGNTGATNVARLCGTRLGIVALALDILKGWFPVWLASCQDGIGTTVLSLVALTTVLGHVFSPFLAFKGGKAVATTIGAYLALAPLVTVLSAAACLGVIAMTGFVSMGSLTLALCLPAFSLLGGRFALLPLALALMAILFWRHRDNIARLKNGEEKPWRKAKEST